MSDVMLMTLAHQIGEEKAKELIKEYNENQDLTQKGKHELISEKFMFTYVEGYNLANKRAETLMDIVEELTCAVCDNNITERADDKEGPCFSCEWRWYKKENPDS